MTAPITGRIAEVRRSIKLLTRGLKGSGRAWLPLEIRRSSALACNNRQTPQRIQANLEYDLCERFIVAPPLG
jgi:hypothetical protein